MGSSMDAHFDNTNAAPGAPGIAPTWCSSAKEAVGCALGSSRLWFTIGRGIINEVYYPRIDIAQIRDLGFIVADDRGFWVEVKRLHNHVTQLSETGVPAVHIVHHHPRFDLHLHVVVDSQRDVLLIDIQLTGDAELRPYALLSPHLGGTGHGNYAQVGEHRRWRVLLAEQGPFSLALAAVDERQCDAWGALSAGYVGVSDGWQDFARHGAMHWRYSHAGPGNVALLGELPRRATLALGFGSSKGAAATLAVSALTQPFDEVFQRYVAEWRAWHHHCGQKTAATLVLPAHLSEQLRNSAMVLRVHQDKTYSGAMVASLSIPWGNTRDERGGYHLVWPRDLVECSGALLALGAIDDARDILRYLIATQHADGHWYQNQWLGGKPYWTGVQLDEVGLPVLLVAALAERDALDEIEVSEMLRRALCFIVRNGPVTQQDRWEENSGINTFTLAVCIAALVCGAQWLDEEDREFVLSLADFWNAQIEEWTSVYDTPLTRRLNVAGYYVRIAPARVAVDHRAMLDVVPIKNTARDPGLQADEQVGGDFLQLVRFGLRRADDPLIRDSITVIDDLLKVETPRGPAWHRYSGDGYGEHEDGTPFDGTGKGRAWPLLTGERGHYELAAQHDALPFLSAMAAMCGSGHLIPEQVWDAAPIAEFAFEPGLPTGAAMPLVWAHAEFIKLAVSYQLGRPFDRPAAVWQRYHGERRTTSHAIWLSQAPLRVIGRDVKLMIVALGESAIVHWSIDAWRTAFDTPTQPNGLGLHVAHLDVRDLPVGESINFTLRAQTTGTWSGEDYSVKRETMVCKIE